MNTAAGIFFYSKNTKRFLYLLRTDNKNPSWGIPGGRIEEGETLLQGLERECTEEISYWPANAKLIPIQKFVNKTFTYHTFFCEVNSDFIPTLNDEHCGFAWVSNNQFPKPLHPGVFSTVNFDIVKKKLVALTEKRA